MSTLIPVVPAHFRTSDETFLSAYPEDAPSPESYESAEDDELMYQPFDGVRDIFPDVSIIADDELGFFLTPHALQRMQQRAITRSDIRFALVHGRKSWSHGCLVFILSDRCLVDSGQKQDASRLRGLKVVVRCDGTVVSVLWYSRHSDRPGVLRGSYRRRRAEELADQEMLEDMGAYLR